VLTRNDRTKIAILRAIHELVSPAGASKVGERLEAMGISLHQRTIRYYLMQLDNEGLTRLVSRRRGRELTERGAEEASQVDAVDKIGIVSAKIDAAVYRMSYSLTTGAGKVIINRSLIDPADIRRALDEMRTVFANAYAVASRLSVAKPGEQMVSELFPDGSLAIGTICSVTLNGIFQKEGIPVRSRFGGLLEIRDRRPTRFVEMIEYRGSTLDPLETFIRADMTSVREVVRRGNGIICASFREIPAVALEHARQVERAMRARGISGVMAMGRPNQPLFDVPVSEGYAGVVVMGGLNPIAALREAGIPATVHSLADIVAFDSLLPVNEVLRRWPLPE